MLFTEKPEPSGGESSVRLPVSITPISDCLAAGGAMELMDVMVVVVVLTVVVEGKQSF